MNGCGKGTVKSSVSNGCSFCGADSKHVRRTDCPAWKFNYYNCGIKGHFGQVCRHKNNPQQCQQHPTTVQEVKTNDLDQNTGNYNIKIGPLVLGSFGIMNRFHEIWQISCI